MSQAKLTEAKRCYLRQLSATTAWAAGDGMRLASMLDALVDDGLAERLPDSRMGAVFRITPAGRAALEAP